MNRIRRISNLQLTIAMICLGISISIAVGLWIGKNGLGFRPLLLGLLLAGGLVLVLLGQRGVEFGLALWIWMFAVGYRTITLTTNLKVHPLTLFLIALLALYLLQASFIAKSLFVFRMPKIIWLFALFWVWGWVVGIRRGYAWDAMTSEFLNFLVIIPLFIVVGGLMQNSANWNRVAISMIGVSLFISLLGIAEYFVPGVGRLLPGFVGTDTYFVAEGGFIRATFASWGSPAAVFIVALALPFALPLWQRWRSPYLRTLLAVAVAIQFVALYFAGYRSLWATVGVTALILIFISKGWLGALAGGVIAWVVYQLLPLVGQSRFLQLISALQGNFQDTSALERWNRLVGAFNVIRTYPLGIGWTGVGWPHSDFLQVAANLGLVAGVLFVGWYFVTLFQVWRACRRKPDDLYLLGLLGSFVVAGGLLIAEGVEVLPQYALPVWFIWALVQVRIQLSNQPIEQVTAVEASAGLEATLQPG